MHARPLFFCPILLSLCATISALPPLLLPDDSALTLFQPVNFTLPITQNLTTTTPITNTKKPTCYEKGHYSTPVSLLTCFEIIATLSRTGDFEKPVLWRSRTPRQAMHVEMGACKLQVLNGADDDIFSVADVVGEMERILEVCQPEETEGAAGTGGQVGIGRYGFVVRVIGPRRWG